MAYPPGISLAVIQAGKAGTFFGDAASLTATVTPVLGGTKYLVHQSTGDLMVPSPQTFTAQNDSVLSFSVPHVDQPGYIDDNATPYTMWAYKVDVTVLIGNGRQVKKHTWTKNFQPLVGQDFIDIDTIASGNISEAISAPLPEVLSINGETGHVTIDSIVSDEDILAVAVPRVGGDMTGGLTLHSTPDGGDDNFDSTSRVTMESYQTGGSYDFGESFRMVLRKDNAKAMLAWQDGFSTPERVANPKTIAWAGAHYEAQHGDKDNADGAVHGHWAVEVPGKDNALRTRFEVLCIDELTEQWGTDNTLVRTNHADLIVTVAPGDDTSGAEPVPGTTPNAFRVAGSNTWHKDMVFTNFRDRNPWGRRWVLRANNTTEDGNSNGTDFEILRQGNPDTELKTSLFIRRRDGKMGLGGNRAPAAMLHINAESGNTNEPLLTLEAKAPLTGGPAIRVLTQASGETILAARSGTDTGNRYQIGTDGKMTWGSGSNWGDVAIERPAEALLRVTQNFDVTKNLRLGSTALNTTAGVGGGVGVVAIGNAATVPTSNPTGGGVLYVEGGALKFRGSAGTITTIANA